MSVKSVLSGAITVKELRNLLESFDDDAKVIAVSDYGDRSHTQQVHVLFTVDEGEDETFAESAYSNSGVELRDFDDDDDDDDDDDELTEDLDASDYVIIRL